MPEPQFLESARAIALKLGYQLVRYVACGAFKETYEAVSSEGKRLALKIMDPTKCDMCRNERELESMTKCDHEGIGQLVDSGEAGDGSGQKFYYAIEEFLDGGSLHDRLEGGVLSARRVAEYGYHLSKALEHLATLDLVHRDVKPENIMFRADSHSPILVDFGLVRDLSKTSLTQSWQPAGPCTPYYAAPEQLNNEKNLIDWRTDQFSLAVVLCCCLAAKHPYEQKKDLSSGGAIEAVAARRECAAWFRTLAEENELGFLVKMLHPWPHRRFTVPSDMVSAFQARR